MTVYVDPIGPSVVSRRWPYPKSCHLVADTLEELHAFAQRLGLKRAWFQNQSIVAHYDLNERRRRVAVQLGAKEISRHELGQMIWDSLLPSGEHRWSRPAQP